MTDNGNRNGWRPPPLEEEKRINTPQENAPHPLHCPYCDKALFPPFRYCAFCGKKISHDD